MVEFLQNILIYLRLYNGKIDGIFGPNLRNAVIQFQRQNGLTADGIVGPRTWLALRPYIDGGLGFIVPTNIRYSSSILQINLNSLKRLYPFIEITSARPKCTWKKPSCYKNWKWLKRSVLLRFFPCK